MYFTAITRIFLISMEKKKIGIFMNNNCIYSGSVNTNRLLDPQHIPTFQNAFTSIIISVQCPNGSLGCKCY